MVMAMGLVMMPFGFLTTIQPDTEIIYAEIATLVNQTCVRRTRMQHSKGETFVATQTVLQPVHDNIVDAPMLSVISMLMK
jgi:hypothetical protein